MKNLIAFIILLILTSCAKVEQEIIKDALCIVSVRFIVAVALIWLLALYLINKFKQ